MDCRPFDQTAANNSLLAVLSMPGCFTASECAAIIDLGKRRNRSQGIARGEFSSIRQSSVCFLPQDPESNWIYVKMSSVISAANERYRFHLHGYREPLQVAEYESGGHYDWHLDLGSDVTSGRKLSASVQLSDGDSYEGGELEFLNIKTPALPRSIGSVIIFPSYLPHRVKPVTRGIRQSLVAWIHGTPFA